MAGTSEVAHAVCTACGCTCDDIRLQVEAGRIAEAVGACALGQSYFAAQSAEPGLPGALLSGREAPEGQALDVAARLLAAARYPLLYGLRHTTAEAQRAAARLADLLGANIDPAGPKAESLALQFGGKVTCSLGEVRNRADLVLYWGCNPAVEYPHHFSRYTLDAPGRWVPNGRKDRSMILIDSRPDLGSSGADQVLPVPGEQQFEWLQVLRALLRGRPVNPVPGLDLFQAQALLDRMKLARFGVIFFGPRLSDMAGGWATVAALNALVADLNQFTRFYAIPMGGEGNSAGAEGVLAAETGYPFGVNLSRGYPRYGPGEFTAAALLERGEADALLAITADPAAELPAGARLHLGRIPVVLLNPTLNSTSRLARVHLTTAPYGVSAEGTVYRVDEVSLPLRPSLTSPYPTDEAMLNRLYAAVEELKHA